MLSTWIAVFVLGFCAGTIAECRNRQKCSIPPSESLDTLTRMNKLARRKEDEDVSHSRRNIPDRRHRKDNEACEKVKLHWGEK
jgi:hypothetical protein